VTARPAEAHRATTLDQFTRQATGFSNAPTMNDVAVMARLVEVAELRPSDTLLDVACGPGIVAAALAPHVGAFIGIDATPAMIELARARVADGGIENATFVEGEVVPLPFPDRSFTRVVCRYALHHLLDPAGAVAEMVRVCAPGGLVVLVDLEADPDPAIAARLDASELARDPSHVRAVTAGEMLTWLRATGADAAVVDRYRLDVEVEALLGRSASPDPDEVRRLLAAEADAGGGPLGVRRDTEGQLRFAYPAVIVTGRLPA